MGEADHDDDPYGAEHVAPAVAWLVSERARVTGRVFEVGGETLSIAEGWRQAASSPLPNGVSVSEVGELLERLVAEAPAPRAVLRADASTLTAQT
jgi:hypothetical protein